MTNYYNDVYIKDKYSLLASKKYSPVVIPNVNKIIEDYYMGEKSIELAESKYQEITIKYLKNKYKKIDLIISGDLQSQILSSTLASSKFKLPTLGIYSACASFIEGIIIASSIINNNKCNIIVSTSSHNLVSEKQFRFPVEYGAVRKRVNTCTASGSVSAIITNEKSNIKIESSTIGFITQTNHRDANDMGSAMAPSCAEVLNMHLKNTNRSIDYYDLILTGDLGEYGLKIMKRYFKIINGKSLNNVIDSGTIFYKDKNIYAGASGPACLPLVFFDYIIPKKKYKKILLIGTGSMHSVTSTNLKVPIPSISHAIGLEVNC